MVKHPSIESERPLLQNQGLVVNFAQSAVPQPTNEIAPNSLLVNPQDVKKDPARIEPIPNIYHQRPRPTSVPVHQPTFAVLPTEPSVDQKVVRPQPANAVKPPQPFPANIEITFNNTKHRMVWDDLSKNFVLLTSARAPPSTMNKQTRIPGMLGVWNWCHDGTRKNGEITLYQNGQVTSESGWLGGSWRELSEIHPENQAPKHGFFPGNYILTEGCVVTQARCKNSNVLRNVDVGNLVNITEVVELPEQSRIRGKVQDGWITIKDTSRNFCWMKPHTGANNNPQPQHLSQPETFQTQIQVHPNSTRARAERPRRGCKNGARIGCLFTFACLAVFALAVAYWAMNSGVMKRIFHHGHSSSPNHGCNPWSLNDCQDEQDSFPKVDFFTDYQNMKCRDGPMIESDAADAEACAQTCLGLAENCRSAVFSKGGSEIWGHGKCKLAPQKCEMIEADGAVVYIKEEQQFKDVIAPVSGVCPDGFEYTRHAAGATPFECEGTEEPGKCVLSPEKAYEYCQLKTCLLISQLSNTADVFISQLMKGSIPEGRVHIFNTADTVDNSDWVSCSNVSAPYGG